MIEPLGRLLASTIGPIIAREGRRLARVVAFGVAAAGFLAGVVVFLIVAGFFWLSSHFPPAEAALLMAAALLVLAIICILAIVLTGRRHSSRPVAPAEITPLVNSLKAAGCDAEAAGLVAGTLLGKRIKPYYLVAAAVAAGLILGFKLKPGKPPER